MAAIVPMQVEMILMCKAACQLIKTQLIFQVIPYTQTPPAADTKAQRIVVDLHQLPSSAFPMQVMKAISLLLI